MAGKGFRISKTEARELKRRSDRVDRAGAVPHQAVVARMHARMDRELRTLVRAYQHPGPDLPRIVEAMAITRAEGVDVTKSFLELLEKIAVAARSRAA